MKAGEPLAAACSNTDLQGQRSVLLSFLGLNLLAGLSVGVPKVILSLYALELQANALQLGIIAGAQILGLLLMSLPAGVLVDQHGPIRLFTIGTLTSGLLYLVIPGVDSANLLCLAIVLISCFMPLRIVSLNAMFMQQIGRVGVGMAGWFRASHMIGLLLLGPLLAAVLLEKLDFTGSYIAVGVTFLFLVLIAPGVLRHYQRPEGTPRKLSLAELRAQLALLGHDRELRGACLREFCLQGANQFYSFFIVIIAIQSFRFDTASAAGLLCAQGCSFILALLVMGNVASRASPALFLRCSYVVIAAALLILGMATASWGLWIGSLGLGWGMGMLLIINIGSFARIGAQRGQGRIAGLNTFVGPAGGLTGSTFGGMAGYWLDLSTTFVLMAMVFIALLAASLVRRTHIP